MQDLGFAPSYELDIDPEFPADGNWSVPEFRFGYRSSNTLTLRIRPKAAMPWVVSFAVETRGRLMSGLYACPNPGHLFVAAGTAAYLVRAAEPGSAEELPLEPVLSVRRPAGTDLLVIGSFTGLAAIDDLGLRWVTGQLFTDDLEFVDGPPGKICVKGRNYWDASGSPPLVIGPDRGEVIEGSWNPAVAGPHARPGWWRSGL
jgi:hypothetical protein